MRKYLVPLLLFSAIGVVIVVLVKSRDGEDPREQPQEETAEGDPTPAEESSKSLLDRSARQTPTKLSRSRWLSELERVLAGNMKHAHHYKAKLMEQMDSVLEDDVLVRNLIDAIRKYAIEERDPEKRKLLLPILRLLITEEATRIIEEEYYRTTDESERLILIDAMSHPEHNPDTAGVWAADMAINSEDIEHRTMSFTYIQNLDNSHHEVVVRTAKQIYEGSTRPEQRVAMIAEVTRRAEETEAGRAFLRERLENPRDGEITAVIGYIEGWADLRDAILLEALAEQYPAMRDILRERAEKIRTMARIKDDPDAAKAILSEKERLERERQKRENEQE